MSKKILSVILAIVVMASLCMVSASAASNEVAATAKSLHKGDTVEYSVTLKYGDDDKDLVAAINGLITYDAEVLKIEDTRKDITSILPGVVKNTNDAGKIKFNAAAGVDGMLGFKNGGNVMTVKFAVQKDADETTVNFNTEELFNLENVAITSGVTAAAKVTCPHNKTSDSDKPSDTDSDKKTDTDKNTDKTSETESDTNEDKAPQTGDIATVVMMLVFAAAAVAVIAKKREA